MAAPPQKEIRKRCEKEYFAGCICFCFFCTFAVFSVIFTFLPFIFLLLWKSRAYVQDQIDVTSIEDSPGKEKFPKIIDIVGKNPLRYPDPDEE